MFGRVDYESDLQMNRKTFEVEKNESVKIWTFPLVSADWRPVIGPYLGVLTRKLLRDRLLDGEIHFVQVALFVLSS